MNKKEVLIYTGLQHQGPYERTYLFARNYQDASFPITFSSYGIEGMLPNKGSKFEVVYRFNDSKEFYIGISMKPLDPGAFD